MGNYCQNCLCIWCLFIFGFPLFPVWVASCLLGGRYFLHMIISCWGLTIFLWLKFFIIPKPIQTAAIFMLIKQIGVVPFFIHIYLFYIYFFVYHTFYLTPKPEFSVYLQGAKNIYTNEGILEEFMKNPIKSENSEKRVVIIFHCEFSSERGPKLSRFLRSKDRLSNKDCYPNLHYPELYLLDGGYKSFFESQKVCILNISLEWQICGRVKWCQKWCYEVLFIWVTVRQIVPTYLYAYWKS